jgi:four helix bundle protein
MNGAVRTFRDVLAWRRAHELVVAVYRLSAAVPREELFGLTAQMRDSAVSVPANVAEAFGRSTAADKARILNIAQGSLEELKYYLVLASDLGYFSDDSTAALAEEVGRLLFAYRRKVLASAGRSSAPA